MRHLGDDSRIGEIQDEIMSLGFIRRPGDGDEEKLQLFRELQKSVKNRYSYKKYNKKVPVTISDVVKEVYPELLNEPRIIEDAEIKNVKTKKNPEIKVKKKSNVKTKKNPEIKVKKAKFDAKKFIVNNHSKKKFAKKHRKI